jgi:hypothetical protein
MADLSPEMAFNLSLGLPKINIDFKASEGDFDNRTIENIEVAFERDLQIEEVSKSCQSEGDLGPTIEEPLGLGSFNS